MSQGSALFEKLIERFLRKDLDRHVRLLSWVTLVLVAACLWLTIILYNYAITVRDKATGIEKRFPLKALIFKETH